MHETEYKIRTAGFEDAEAIFRLVKEYPDELLPRALSDIVQNIDRFLVGDVRGEVAGTVSWQILPEIGMPRDPSVEIKSLAVRKNMRGSGIGAALVRAAVERIEAVHPARIIALTFTPEFFLKMGFVETPKESLMHKIYQGCINCTKYDSPFTCPEVAMVIEKR
ncbi:MAG: GNAT family N-acetyltransferase [Lentisphaerae bacterium]|nr:GNAT family N-acetyltransferase [Lentisphaerota bacterium]